MAERAGAITFKGNPMTLVGSEIKEGDTAPDFTLIATDLSEKHLADYAGKKLILSTVPSLDTGVCDAETRRFNEEAAKLGDDVQIVTVSMDLPFAQKRWCGAAGVDRVETLSDYRDREFAQNYGLLIKELGLLARCVLVIDPEGKVRYRQLVPEVAQEPDYEGVIGACRSL